MANIFHLILRLRVSDSKYYPDTEKAPSNSSLPLGLRLEFKDEINPPENAQGIRS